MCMCAGRLARRSRGGGKDGDLIGKLVISSRAARDAWLSNGNPYFTQPGARTAIKSRYAAKFRRISGNVERVE